LQADCSKQAQDQTTDTSQVFLDTVEPVQPKPELSPSHVSILSQRSAWLPLLDSILKTS